MIRIPLITAIEANSAVLLLSDRRFRGIREEESLINLDADAEDR